MARHQLSLPLADSLNRSSLPEARLLHEAQAPGFFALLTKPSPADMEHDRRKSMGRFAAVPASLRIASSTCPSSSIAWTLVATASCRRRSSSARPGASFTCGISTCASSTWTCTSRPLPARS